ncbi:hypothetical protein C2845_PM17G12700 [Panicum miliaceum]|uniref:F-box domain-containing protein n=1 Tax=Panicum miliaceum TaxID=4540 RepID=A0A3L6PZF2_PANMI|nr:hypothetical protein C2845_PM17G12700 [Panicum miliaceum]
MDSRKATSGDRNRHAPLPDCVSKGVKPSRSLAAVAKTRCSTECATASEAPRSDDAQRRGWVHLPADILGVVVSRLPLFEDRARLRSVCRTWRLHRRPPPPLPLLVLSDFSLASFRAEGTLTGVRRRVPLPDRETGAAGSVRCVGSFEGWLVAVKLDKGRYFGDLRQACSLRSGMKSWCVCDGGCIIESVDIIFCQEKLYMLSISESTANLFAFEISDDDDCLMVSRVECREIDERPVVMDSYRDMWGIVEWRGKVLIVATYSHDAEFQQKITDVRVFEADLSTNPVRLTEIESLDGDCICFSPCSSKSFRSCDYDGVEGDLIYFIDGCSFDSFVYNMKDGTLAPVAADIPEHKLRASDGRLMNPTWFFPPELNAADQL